MFYRPEDGHGLPHDPLTAIVAPRPIAWVSTRGAAGDNLAPYSFFTAVAYAPPQVVFASTGRKDSLGNIEQTGVFAISVVEHAMRAAMNLTSGRYPAGTDEFALAGVPKAECARIDCPRVMAAPATLECRMTGIVPLQGKDNSLILGEVVGVHLRDDCVIDGRLDVTTYAPIARLGYRDYAVVRETFAMARPDER
jgi:flavin reductase (DIM6/NTAB) family NADH-FMN oxidoreductase RutF